MKQQDNVYELISLSASSHKGDAFYVVTMFRARYQETVPPFLFAKDIKLLEN